MAPDRGSGADPDAQGINGWTPLHDAGFVGKLDVVKALVPPGAKLRLLNENGETPLGTTRRGLQFCQTRDPQCPITQGLTDATQADYQAVISYLMSVGG